MVNIGGSVVNNNNYEKLRSDGGIMEKQKDFAVVPQNVQNNYLPTDGKMSSEKLETQSKNDILDIVSNLLKKNDVGIPQAHIAAREFTGIENKASELIAVTKNKRKKYNSAEEKNNPVKMASGKIVRKFSNKALSLQKRMGKLDLETLPLPTKETNEDARSTKNMNFIESIIININTRAINNNNYYTVFKSTA